MSEEMKKYHLTLRKVEYIEPDYYVFEFDKPDDFVFTEGQYGVFMHVDKQIEGRKVRAFSVASSTDENIVLMATKIIKEPSDFKSKMLLLKQGDQMTFDGPMGSFTLEQEYPSVFIAGGIGITPIRSMAMQLKQLKNNMAAELIYSEPRGIYPFSTELDELTFIDKHYVNNIEDTKSTIASLAKKYVNTAFYYISGSPSFVNDITEQLKGFGVETSHIKFDRFNGY